MPTYRGDGAWGTGKGSPLTIPEADGNVYEFSTRIGALESSPPVAISVVSVTRDGTALTFHLTDGSTTGPVDILPVLPRIRGAWAAGQMYSALDFVTVDGEGVFLVLVDHVAAATFDPAALGPDITAGSFVVGLDYTITAVGTTDFTLIGAASNTVGVEFTATGVGAGTGTAAQKLYYRMFDTSFAPPTYSVPLEGGTVTAAAGEKRRILNPAAPLNALTIVLPPGPAGGDEFELWTSQTISSLTVTGGPGTGIMLTGKLTWIYSTDAAAWIGPT